MNKVNLLRKYPAMNERNKTGVPGPTSLFGVIFLFLSWFFPWVGDPYTRQTLKPIKYFFQGIDLFSITLWLLAILSVFIIILALKRRNSKGLSRVTGALVIVVLLILNFPALDSETRLPATIGLGSILALLAAVLLIIPDPTGIFSFLRKHRGPDTQADRTIAYLGILLFLSCWLPWTKGFYSWFGKNLIDLLPGHKYNFYFPSLFILATSILAVWAMLKKDARIPAFISGALFMAYFFYLALLQGILQTFYSRSIGFFAALAIAVLLLWRASGKKIDRNAAHLKNLLRLDVLLAAILAVVFPLNIFPAHGQYSMPKLNPVFELGVFIVPFFSLLSIFLAWVGKNNGRARRAAAWLALIFLIAYALSGSFFVFFLIISVKGVLVVIAILGLIVMPSKIKNEHMVKEPGRSKSIV